jgi:hypothetical protein
MLNGTESWFSSAVLWCRLRVTKPLMREACPCMVPHRQFVTQGKWPVFTRKVVP